RFSRDWSSDVCSSDLGALRRTGTLAFFYDLESMKWGFDPADRGCSHVAYFDATVPLQPLRLTPTAAVSAPCRLSFIPHLDLPARSEERRVGKERDAAG